MSEMPTVHDEERFNEALNGLLQAAHENGVDVEGGWKCTTEGNGDVHWDVQITNVKYGLDK